MQQVEKKLIKKIKSAIMIKEGLEIWRIILRKSLKK